MFHLSTEIALNRCPGTNEGNDQYEEAKVTIESVLARQEGNTLIWTRVGGKLTDVDTKGKW